MFTVYFVKWRADKSVLQYVALALRPIHILHVNARQRALLTRVDVR